ADISRRFLVSGYLNPCLTVTEQYLARNIAPRNCKNTAGAHLSCRRDSRAAINQLSMDVRLSISCRFCCSPMGGFNAQTRRCPDSHDGVRAGCAFRRACIQEEGLKPKHSGKPRTTL